MFVYALSLIFALFFASSCSGLRDPSTTPVNEWPIIMAHDAATTYLEGGLLHQINNWAKTQQDGGPSGLLNCGARSFDWRPLMDKGSLVMHHGSIKVNHAMSDALNDMVKWASAHPSVEDTVFLMITDCSGDGCDDAVASALSSRNITYINDCSELKNLMVADAHQRGKLPSGGSILAIHDCWVSYYESSVACSGYGDTANAAAAAAAATTGETLEGKSFYTCYSDSSSKSFPLNRMWSYVDNTTASGPPIDGRMWTLQTLWEETAASVAIGELHGSTLLDDEKRSSLNALVTARIKSGDIDASRINFIEVNNVCDGGNELLDTIRALS